MPKKTNLLSEDNAEFITKTLKDGVATDFWGVMVEAIDKRMNLLEEMFLNSLEDYEGLPADECKVRVMFHVKSMAYLDSLKDLPNSIFREYNKTEHKEQEFDPYEK